MVFVQGATQAIEQPPPITIFYHQHVDNLLTLFRELLQMHIQHHEMKFPYIYKLQICLQTL